MTRNPNMREAILSAAELLFSTRGFNAVSIRDIAQEAGANPGSVTYHFKSKDGLLLEIYRRHCGPMNQRRIELLVAARRVRDVQNRLEAIVRAYVLPAFSSSDLAGGGARFTRLRAVMSAEGNEVVGRIIAEIFDDTTNAFIDAIEQSLPHLPRTAIVWRSQFLLGALYYTLVTPERVTRLSRGEADGADMAEAIEQLVSATVASLQASASTSSSRQRSVHAGQQPVPRTLSRRAGKSSAGQTRQVPSFCAKLIESRLKKRNSDGSNENRPCSIGASRRFRLARRWRDRAARQKRLSRQDRVPFVW